jgi:WD40 repeat protein
VIQTPTSSNLLAASVEQWQRPCDDADEGAGAPDHSYIISTGADKQVHVLETTGSNAAVKSFADLSSAPVLSYVSILQGRYILLTNMSGQILLQHGTQLLDSRKDHGKYAVKVVAYEDKKDPSKWWIATAGWDETVVLYNLNIPDEVNAHTLKIGEPVARIKLASNPESLLFVPHIDTNDPLLLVSRRDSTYIHYYQVEETPEQTASHSSPRECQLLAYQNLAPHSNAWVAFSPAHMVLSPHDPGLLAVATSTLPHLKVIIVRLLFPSLGESDTENDSASANPVTQASQAMEALALADREDAAILVQANTFATQTAYSTPQVAWRPDGSGVWVNGDDGVVRGIETKTGKVITTLKGGHEPGCKVRTVWSGYVSVLRNGEPVREEWVISGGFDRRLVVWKV